MGGEHGKAVEYEGNRKKPRKSRSCTDVYCLFIFLAFVIGWAGIGVYAYSNGDVVRLLSPTDSEGQKCGLDEEVIDKRYLVFFNLAKCVNTRVSGYRCDTPQVCVEACPRDNFVWISNSTALMNDLEKLRASMICKIEVNLTSSTYEEMATYVSEDVCASWYLNSSSRIGRCIPNKVPESFVDLTLTLEELAEASATLVRIEEIVTNVYSDFLATRWLVLAILGCSALVSLTYILLLHWIATTVVFVSIVAAFTLLVYSTFRFYVFYAEVNSAWWLAFAVTSGITLGIFLLICIFLRNRILLACKLISESSRAVTNSTLSLFFPLVPGVLKILTLGYTVLITVYLSTLRVHNYTVQLGGNCECDDAVGYTNGTTCSPTVFATSCSEDNATCISGGCYLSSTTTSWFTYCMLALNVVGLFWVIFFTSAFGNTVLAGTFATWYWTIKKSDVPCFTLTASVWRTIRYHMGTLALGSLLITIFSLIRWPLEIFGLQPRCNNAFVRFLLKWTNCYCSILDVFLKFVNSNAYVMCAINGEGFCRSAKTAVAQIRRNIVRVFVLDKVPLEITEWVLFVGKSIITVGAVWSAWWFIAREYTEINYRQVPLVLVMIGTYFIASVFVSVYSTAIETIFHCFLEDSESNDGTPEKPYHMSQSLMKILYKP